MIVFVVVDVLVFSFVSRLSVFLLLFFVVSFCIFLFVLFCCVCAFGCFGVCRVAFVVLLVPFVLSLFFAIARISFRPWKTEVWRGLKYTSRLTLRSK